MGQESAQLVGQILADTYRVERLLGGGGMGAVYEASHLRLRRHFAVKVLFAEVAANEEALLRFQREAQITSGLGHPNIVEVIDFNHTPDGAPYLVMELLEGRDLEAVLAGGAKLALDRAVKIFAQVGAALLAAHAQGIIHRDLKPSNVFLCDVGGRHDVVKVVDFGISKVLGSKSVVTRTQATMGTPGYMSPEQAEGRAAEVDVRTDIFALGTMLFEMLSGRTPFDGETIPTMLYKVVHVAPPALRSFRGDLPPAVEAVVHCAMEKKPENRFQTVNEMLASLGEALAGTSASLSASLVDAAAGVPAPGDKPESLGAQALGSGAIAPTLGDAAGVSETTLSSSDVEVRPVPGAAQGTRKKAGFFAALALALVVLVGAGVAVFLLRTEADSTPLGASKPPVVATPAALPEPPEATQPALGAAPATAPKIVTIAVEGRRSGATCRLTPDGAAMRLGTLPCRFKVLTGTSVTLELRRRGARSAELRFVVGADRRLWVRRTKRALVLVDDAGQLVSDVRPTAKKPATKKPKKDDWGTPTF